MAKEKKITVKFYLNKERKSRFLFQNNGNLGSTEIHVNKFNKVKLVLPSDSNEEGGIELYPVYVRVTYNRKNTQFKLILPNQDYSTILFPLESEINGVENYKYKDAIAKKKRLIERVVRAEIEKKGDSFNLNGIAERISSYEIPVALECGVSLTSNLDNLYVSYFGKDDYAKIVVETNPFSKISLANKLNGDKEIKLPKNLKSLLLLTHFLPNEITIYDWKYASAKEVLNFAIETAIARIESGGKDLKNIYMEFEEGDSIRFTAEEFYLLPNQVIRIESIINSPSSYFNQFFHTK